MLGFNASDKEIIYDNQKWFKFFDEKMFIPFVKSESPIDLHISLWNCAQPTEWTSEDGKEYAAIIREIAEISPQIKKDYSLWSNNITLIPEAVGIANKLNEMDIEYIVDDIARPCCGGGCGSFVYNLVPIPHGLFTMCHRGLFDAYVDYANNFKNKENMNNLSKEFFQAKNSFDWIYTKDQMKRMEKTMSDMYCYPNQIRYTDLTISIREYAMAGIIDEKYKDISEIEKTLGNFLFNSYCLQDAYIFTGSWTTNSMMEIPLFYNGIMEVVANEIERIRVEKGWSLK